MSIVIVTLPSVAIFVPSATYFPVVRFLPVRQCAAFHMAMCFTAKFAQLTVGTGASLAG